MSGVTGEGLPELLAELDRLGAQVPARPAYPATRMPVDRVFSLRGIGTVVTGTLWSGTLSAEDMVAVLPPARAGAPPTSREVRVRSVQVHDKEVDAATGGQRVALNLTGVARDDVDRGQWVVKDPAIEPTYLADARLTLLSDAPGPVPRVFRGPGGSRHRRDAGQGGAGRSGDSGARESPATPSSASRSRCSSIRATSSSSAR